MSRKVAREHAFKLLYQIEIHKGYMDEVMEMFFHENIIDDQDAHYIQDIVKGTMLHKEIIDNLISTNTLNWDVHRISKVSMAILRLSVYEMLEREDIPKSVSINEAIELAKKYDNVQSGAFVNGILGAVQKQLSTNHL